MRPLTARGQATRDKLVEAAREVFAERGFAATRMGDLADAAGVSHGTVYTYFDTKEDVLLAVLDAVRSDLHAAMTLPTVRNPIARIEAANRAYLDGYRSHAHLLRVAEQASAGDERFRDVLLDLRRTHVGRVAAAIRKLQGDGLAARDLDAHTAAAALCGMVEGFAAHWLGRGEVHDEALATRTLTQLWVRGLGMPARVEAARAMRSTPGPGATAPAQPRPQTGPSARNQPSPSGSRLGSARPQGSPGSAPSSGSTGPTQPSQLSQPSQASDSAASGPAGAQSPPAGPSHPAPPRLEPPFHRVNAGPPPSSAGQLPADAGPLPSSPSTPPSSPTTPESSPTTRRSDPQEESR